MTPFDPTAIIDANGWDMVIGVPLAVVNDALGSAALDLPFAYSTTGGGQSISLAGTFGPWTISGGAGQDLSILLPIASGTAAVSGSASNPFDVPPGNYDLAGLSVSVTTRLQFETDACPAQPVSLTFAFDDVSGTPDCSPFAPQGGSLSGAEDLPALLQQMLPTMMASCLAANLKAMNMVFAEITASMGSTKQGAKNTQGQWQYVVASQQGIAGESLAIFYAADPTADLNATIPEAISPQNGQCIVVLSQAMALSGVVLPAILYGLNHTSAPMQSSVGIGPMRVGPLPQSNDFQASQFLTQPGPPGTNSAVITANAPIQLELGGFSSGATATLSNFYCLVSGQNLTISFEAETSADATFNGTASQGYNLRIGEQWCNDQQVFGIRLWPLSSGMDRSPDAMQLLVFGAVSEGLESAPLPFTFSLFSGQVLRVEAGYLNGGLGLVGSIVTENAPQVVEG